MTWSAGYDEAFGPRDPRAPARYLGRRLGVISLAPSDLDRRRADEDRLVKLSQRVQRREVADEVSHAKALAARCANTAEWCRRRAEEEVVRSPDLAEWFRQEAEAAELEVRKRDLWLSLLERFEGGDMDEARRIYWEAIESGAISLSEAKKS